MTIGDASYWDDLFQQSLVPAILAHVIATWEKIPKPGPSDLEDEISDRLHAALINSKIDKVFNMADDLRLAEIIDTEMEIIHI